MPVKNEEETMEKITEISRNNDYTTGNLSDFAYFKENYRLIAIDWSKQTKLKDQQQINYIGKLEMEQQWNYSWIFIKFCKHLIKMEIQKIVNLVNSSENEY